MKRANAPEFIRAINREYSRSLIGVSTPIHIVDPTATRGRYDNIVVHSARIRKDEMVQIAPGLFVTTPERTILDLCRSHSAGSIAVLMSEMCGLYAISPNTERLEHALDQALQTRWGDGAGGAARFDKHEDPSIACGRPIIAAFLDADGKRIDYSALSDSWTPCIGRNGRRTTLWKRPPLCTVDSLIACARLNAGATGIRRFREALRYVVEGSGSPAETACAMLMGPNRSIGQEGLPPVQLNRRVMLDDISQAALGQQYCVVDITWSAGRRVRRGCCVEVDGAAFHDDSEIDPSKLRGTCGDSARRAALAHMGLNVITVSWSQICNLEQWDTVVDLVYRHLGIKRRPFSEASLLKRERLHRELLFERIH